MNRRMAKEVSVFCMFYVPLQLFASKVRCESLLKRFELRVSSLYAYAIFTPKP